MVVSKYKWFSVGDLNASATMIFDNLTCIATTAFLLSIVIGFPSQFVLTHIVPGMAVGIIVSNLASTLYAFRLAKKLNRDDITAFPIGLDAPTCIGFTLAVTGPAFMLFKSSGLDVNAAALSAWHVSCACVFMIGLTKFIFSFFAEKISKHIPVVALLGALAGVSIGLIAFFPLLSMMQLPFLSIGVLVVICMVYFAGYKIPFNLPAVLVMVVLASVGYYAYQYLNTGKINLPPAENIAISLPIYCAGIFNAIPNSLRFLSIALPFAFLVIFGSVSVIESARISGTEYSTKKLMMIDSVSTMIMAMFGATSQTTPYPGFPAYKKMNARAGYILLDVLFIGVGAFCGGISYILALVPESIFAPVLLYIGIEISMQVFIVADKKYYSAAIFGLFPSIAHLLQIKLTDPSWINMEKLTTTIHDVQLGKLTDIMAVVVLGNGFIVTGTLWAALAYYIIERNIKAIVICCLTLAGFSLFGVIHSINLDGAMYWIFSLPKAQQIIPIELAAGYVISAILAVILHRLNKGKVIEVSH